ncbi:MAG: dephospho-CoA kinase [Candidatus Marinimicrobia bacterium]|nr:dephospho-CoA kinase [Candidatus Neomarinimicrobiota bacterium]
MLRIGITGGLGSGKSVVADFFRAQGSRVFDADSEAKLILLRSAPVQQAVIDHFGDHILNEVGELDFRLLAQCAFATEKQQRYLNNIIHPEVAAAAELAMIAAQGEGVAMFVLDAALLFEAQLEEYLDFTIAVIADEELRVKRALERGNLTEKDIRKRIRLQLTDDIKQAKADFIIDNNGTPDELAANLEDLYAMLESSSPF